MNAAQLQEEIGNVDLYLLDQILKGRFDQKKSVLDVGCGEGRNLTYFVRNNFRVFGIDKDPMAVKMAQMRFRNHEFKQADANRIPYPDTQFDIVLSSAVLHFAESREAFLKQLNELLRVLHPQGILFIRMATSIGLETSPDDTFRYLLSQQDVDDLRAKMTFIEPFKTVLVENQRSMASLVISKKFF